VLEPARAGDERRAAVERLSRRERQVLHVTSLGLTNGQIAQRLEISEHAVKFHLSSIYRKLGVANRTEATVVYLRAGAAAT
jgi:two-component system, NarL family, response regulator YdfI